MAKNIKKKSIEKSEQHFDSEKEEKGNVSLLNGKLVILTRKVGDGLGY